MRTTRPTATLISLVMAVAACGPSASATPSPTPLTTAASSPSAVASAPTLAPSQLAAPSLPDPAIWANDGRLRWCGGLNHRGTRVLTIFEFTHASDYRDRLPGLGYSAALEKPGRVLVLVYDGASPSDLYVWNGSPSTHTPAQGTYDICVGALDWHQRFLNVQIDWAHFSAHAVRLVTLANTGERRSPVSRAPRLRPVELCKCVGELWSIRSRPGAGWASWRSPLRLRLVHPLRRPLRRRLTGPSSSRCHSRRARITPRTPWTLWRP